METIFVFFGVNNAAFPDRSLDNFTSLVDGIDPSLLTSFSGASANPGKYETPTVRYNSISYEYALMDVDDDNSILETQFKVDAVNKVEPQAAYTLSTASPLKLLRGEFTPEAEDGGEYYAIATHGAFTVLFDSGALVTLSVLSAPEADRAGQTAKNVRLTLDLENDGNLEADKTMSWLEFEFAYVPLLR